ncbi:TPA: hypothetical protein N3A33_005057 [Salmonella enterica subsp. salamae serovar 28:r:e,n,z15]|nr:hypothetical protein [Salmonella enterica subsp. salamae serovar 28:r:e,n,z15]
MATKLTKNNNISMNNVNEVQHQQVTKVSKEAGDFLTIPHSPESMQFPENTALKANYSIRTENTVSEYQHIADTECNQHIMQIDSAQDKRDYEYNNYICGCGCESCCGCCYEL